MCSYFLLSNPFLAYSGIVEIQHCYECEEKKASKSRYTYRYRALWIVMPLENQRHMPSSHTTPMMRVAFKKLVSLKASSRKARQPY